jgi:quinol-cytochrome oxidoreductase complex cytochrome b subunit
MRDMPESETKGPRTEMSEAAAALGIFTSPSATFAALARKPTWWLPFVAGLLVSAVLSFVMTDKMDYDASMRQAIEKRAAKSGQTMPAAEMGKSVDTAVEMQRKLAPYYPTIGAAGYSFFFFLIALVLAFSASAFGAEAKIPVYLAVYSHAQIPLVLRSIYGTIRLLSAADGSLTFEQLGRIGTIGPALFLPASSPAAPLALASSLDLGVLATVGLLVLGFRRLPGLSRASATGVPIALYGLFVLIRICWAALFG